MKHVAAGEPADMLFLLESFVADGAHIVHTLKNDRRIRFNRETFPVTPAPSTSIRRRSRRDDGSPHECFTPGLPCFQTQADGLHHPPQRGLRCFRACACHVGGHDCTSRRADTEWEGVREQAWYWSALSLGSKWLRQFISPQDVHQLLVRCWCAGPLLQGHSWDR